MIDIQLLEIGYLYEVSGYLEEKEAITMARAKVQKRSTEQWETLPLNWFGRKHKWKNWAIPCKDQYHCTLTIKLQWILHRIWSLFRGLNTQKQIITCTGKGTRYSYSKPFVRSESQWGTISQRLFQEIKYKGFQASWTWLIDIYTPTWGDC